MTIEQVLMVRKACQAYYGSAFQHGHPMYNALLIAFCEAIARNAKEEEQ